MSARVYARRIEMIAYLQAGYIPLELGQDAMLACEESPPAWQVFKRRRWNRAVHRLTKWLLSQGLR